MPNLPCNLTQVSFSNRVLIGADIPPGPDLSRQLAGTPCGSDSSGLTDLCHRCSLSTKEQSAANHETLQNKSRNLFTCLESGLFRQDGICPDQDLHHCDFMNYAKRKHQKRALNQSNVALLSTGFKSLHLKKWLHS